MCVCITYVSMIDTTHYNPEVWRQSVQRCIQVSPCHIADWRELFSMRKTYIQQDHVVIQKYFTRRGFDSMFPYSSWSLATLCDCRNMGLQFEPNDHAQHVLRGQRQVRMSLLSPSVPTLSYSLPPKENMAVIGCLKICIPKILLLTTQSSSWDDHSIKYGNEKNHPFNII